MFLLVSKFKMIGMLLNVGHGQVQLKRLTKTYNKEVSRAYHSHSTLLAMIELTDHDLRRALD